MWEKEGSKGRDQLWSLIDDDSIFTVLHGLQSASLSCFVPLLNDQWGG